MPDGTMRTIKANYHQVSTANLMRRGGTFAATGVIQVYENKDKETEEPEGSKWKATDSRG